MEEIVKETNKVVGAPFKELVEVQTGENEPEARAPSNTRESECNWSIIGYRINGEEGTIEAHNSEVVQNGKKVATIVGGN